MSLTKNQKYAIAVVAIVLFVYSAVTFTSIENVPSEPTFNYEVRLAADRKNTDGTWELVEWRWDENEATISGYQSKSDFETATIRGDLKIQVVDYDNAFTSVVISWWSKTDSAQTGQRSLVKSTLPGGAGLWEYTWDSASVPDGEYIIQVRGEYDGLLYQLSMIDVLLGVEPSSDNTLWYLAGTGLIIVILVLWYRRR